MSEQAFLGAMITNPGTITAAHRRVRPVDLEDRASMFIFESLIALNLAREPIDVVDVFRKLESLGLAGHSGGGPVLARCVEAFEATERPATEVIDEFAVVIEAARATRPPREDVTEEVVLAGMLHNPEAIGSVVTIVSEIDFTGLGTAAMFRAILGVADYDGGEPPAVLHSKLLGSPAAIAVPDFEAMLARVLDLEVCARQAVEFATLLRNRSTLQRLDLEVDDMARGFLKGSTPEEVIRNTRRRVMQVLMRSGAMELQLQKTPRSHKFGCRCQVCTCEANLSVSLVNAGDDQFAGLRAALEAAVLGSRIALTRGLTPEEASGFAGALTCLVWWIEQLLADAGDE